MATEKMQFNYAADTDGTDSTITITPAN